MFAYFTLDTVYNILRSFISNPNQDNKIRESVIFQITYLNKNTEYMFFKVLRGGVIRGVVIKGYLWVRAF